MASNQPSNASELQLYRVLQRANWLQYFDTFISQGGDDVQQLCEAGEDEFLEIMALVGMASKPLHVRRLQKALQEWVANPAAFEANASKKFPTHVMSMTGSGSQPVSNSRTPTTAPVDNRASTMQDYKVTPPQSSTISTSTPWSSQVSTGGVSPSEGSNRDQPSPTDSQEGDFKVDLYNSENYNSMMSMTQPALMEHQVTAIATAAALLAQELPPFEPKSMPKKQISKEITAVMNMATDDPHKMDLLRKYAAIYGRFDSKRKNDRPMSLHEISVNEAAAQLCSHFPALLTRREELFPLARQVVRDSGYQYSKGHSRAAEIVVPPKSEPPDEVSPNGTPALPLTTATTVVPVSGTTSAPTSSSSEDLYQRVQNELVEVTTTLAELAKEQERIKSALRVLLEANDHTQMQTLTAELDNLNDQYRALTSRRQELVSKLARLRRSTSKFTPGSSLLPSPYVLSSMDPSMSSKSDGLRQPLSNSIPSATFPSNGSTDDMAGNPLNTLYMAAIHNGQDSLIEEGLRIATQYGMSDFAQELMGMKNEHPHEKMGRKDSKASPDAKVGSVPTTCSTVDKTSLALAMSSSALSSPSFMSSSIAKCVKIESVSPTLATPSPSSTPPMSMKLKTVSVPSGSLVTLSSPMAQASTPVTLADLEVLTTSASLATKPKNLITSIIPVVNMSPEDLSFTKAKTPTFNSTLSDSESHGTPIPSPSPIKPVEMETRRSSRRKNGEPDYYLINGGEKRFRTANPRRSSSTSSERAAKASNMSSTSSTSSSPSTTPLTGAISPHRISPSSVPTTPQNVTHTDSPGSADGVIRMNVYDLVGKKGEKKMVSEKVLVFNMNEMSDDGSNSGANTENLDGEVMEVEEQAYSNSDTEKKMFRRKKRSYNLACVSK